MKNLKDNPDGGFSLIEVVVALVMIFFFTNVALQMFVISGIFKKKAVQYTTAISLIQQDMEKIKSAADQYSFPTVSTAVGAIVTLTPNTNGLLPGDKVKFPTDFYSYTISTISGNILTLSSILNTTVPASTPVFNDTSCNLKSTDSASTSKIATYFMNSLSTTSTTVTGIDTSTTSYKISGDSSTIYYYKVTGSGFTNPIQVNSKGTYYWLLRKQEVSTDAPYNILKINYIVQEGTSSDPTLLPPLNTNPKILNPSSTLATSYTEVIPYASLQCPSQ